MRACRNLGASLPHHQLIRPQLLKRYHNKKVVWRGRWPPGRWTPGRWPQGRWPRSHSNLQLQTKHRNQTQQIKSVRSLKPNSYGNANESFSASLVRHFVPRMTSYLNVEERLTSRLPSHGHTQGNKIRSESGIVKTDPYLEIETEVKRSRFTFFSYIGNSTK